MARSNADAERGLPDMDSDAASSAGANAAKEEMTSWRTKIATSIARSRKVKGGNYVQLATVEHVVDVFGNGGGALVAEPRCRTVVFRGFLNHDASAAPSGASPSGKSDAESETATVAMADAADASAKMMLDGQSCVMKMITDARSNKVGQLTSYYATAASSNTDSHSDNDNDASTSTSTNYSTSTSTNNAEIVWYFGKSSEQYRIRGRLVLVGNNGIVVGSNNIFVRDNVQRLMRARKEQWGTLSDLAREQFYWDDPGVPYYDPRAPSETMIPPGGGREVNSNANVNENGSNGVALGKVLPPPDTFLLMLMYPTNVDYLRLGDNYRQVDELVRNGENSGKNEKEQEQGKGQGSEWKWVMQRVNP